MTEGISIKLEAALLHELIEQYRHLAYAYFKNALVLPQIALVTSRARLGRWIEATRTVEISRPLVLEQPWGIVVEVLKHEMAHQYVCEVLGERGESAHGPRFRSVCERLGIDAAAAGMPIPKPNEATTNGERGKVAERIARLLALAESPNVHEAEAAMAAAQKLLLKHNIELREARAAQGYAWKHLGKPTGRTTEAERVLSLLLSKHFFVEAIWVPSYQPLAGKQGRVLELCGTPSNLDVAVYVHGFLMTTAERLWRQHKAQTGVTDNRERRRYLLGVMMGFDDKLVAATADNKREGLIWVGDPALDAYLARRYPRRTGGTGIGIQVTETYEQGRRAGRNIVLSKPIPSPSESRGRLLPSR